MFYSQAPSLLPTGFHINPGDLHEVDIEGRRLHFFVLPEAANYAIDPPTLLRHIYLRVSEVVEGCPTTVIQGFLAHLKELHEYEVPEFVWLDESSDHQAITPVPLDQALCFWSQQSYRGDSWAEDVTRSGVEVERAIFSAFGWEAFNCDQEEEWAGAPRTSECIADGGLKLTSQGYASLQSH